MEKIDINTEHIVSIKCYEERIMKVWKYYPIYTKNKTLKDIIFGESYIRKRNRKEGVIFMTDVNAYFTETELKELSPYYKLCGTDIYEMPKAIIELSSGKNVTMYFDTYDEVLNFAKWLEEQKGYVNLKDFEVKQNCLIYFN